jgi:hypothetical protein
MRVVYHPQLPFNSGLKTVSDVEGSAGVAAWRAGIAALKGSQCWQPFVSTDRVIASSPPHGRRGIPTRTVHLWGASPKLKHLGLTASIAIVAHSVEQVPPADVASDSGGGKSCSDLRVTTWGYAVPRPSLNPHLSPIDPLISEF